MKNPNKIGPPVKEKLPWYLAGSVPYANCAGAYSPFGAKSQAESYLSQNGNPVDGIPVGEPTWDVDNGWKLDHTLGQFIKIPITVQRDWSILIKFSNITGGIQGNRWLCGASNKAAPPNKFDTELFDAEMMGETYAYWNDSGVIAPRITSGVILLSGNKFYANGGVLIGAAPDSGSNTPCVSPFFGVGTVWELDAPQGGLSVYVQRLAIYNTPVDAQAYDLIAAA